MPIYKFWIFFFYQYKHLLIFKKKPVSGYIYIVCFLAGLVSFSPFPTVADRSIQPLPVIHICQEKRRYAYGLNIFIYLYKNIVCTCIFSFFSLSPLEYRLGGGGELEREMLHLSVKQCFWHVEYMYHKYSLSMCKAFHDKTQFKMIFEEVHVPVL